VGGGAHAPLPSWEIEMPKFYVLSGIIKTVLNAADPMDACVQVIHNYEKDEEAIRNLMDFAVSERGFGHNSLDPESDHIIELVEVLQNAGYDLE